MTFSIVTPSFNQLDWLRLCIASVRDQLEVQPMSEKLNSSILSPARALEHIIQDGGTPGIEDFAREVGADFYRDGNLIFESRHLKANGGFTSSAVSGLQANDSSRYRLTIYCERDSGMYDAINHGFRRATGEVYAYLNCDEQYLPGTLSLVSQWFEWNPGKEMVFGDAIVVKSDGSYLCDRRVMVPRNLHTRISGNLSFFTASTFFKSSVVVSRQIVFDPAWKALGDAAWALDLLQQRVAMGVLRKPLATHTDTGENLILSPAAEGERSRMFAGTPVFARWARPFLLLHYRLRRALAGAYHIRPHIYDIYTLSSPGARREFRVEKPAYSWRR